ncbi:hypothetical protein Trebr_1370 [Treponema brennaborense DSM 12168]|uniref:Uncharacterized protein n=1 Tax=Treponema brennaborense (strain DSM 12168 / CIP 105900 / DD5/3) TaxID=906968 RepID=F4LMP7_TREBD|nr:hypothetical protein Trebr_1370 [Treponema brennaborense DSM 12168]
MKSKTQKNSVKKTPPILFTLTNRIVIFLCAFLCILCVFFITANFRQFLDKNVLLILHTMQFAAAFLLPFCMASFVQGIIFAVSYRSIRYAAYAVAAVLAAAFALLFFLFSGALDFMCARLT